MTATFHIPRPSRRWLAALVPPALLLASPLASQDPDGIDQEAVQPGAAQPGAAQPGAAQPAPPADRKERREPFNERLDVRLAELYVTVTSEDGSPVAGLDAADFQVAENGVPQELDAVVDARDLPLTLGLAIDASASMFAKLPAVKSAATALVDGLDQGRDRGLVVAFGPEPQLLHPPTGELGRLRWAVRRLEPVGPTPLWGGVNLALEELTKARGKKALVVFLDGADDDGRVPYREALARAEASAVPIYLIVMNNEAARTNGEEFRSRSFIAQLNRMAAAGGGRVYYLRTGADLTPIYREIERELRSYYLLTYYPDVPLAEGGRRQVKVDVRGKDLEVRTLSSYDPRGR